MVVLNGVPEEPPCFGGYPRPECNDCPVAIKLACVANLAEERAPRAERKGFYRAAAIWAEKAAVALVIIAVLVTLGVVVGVKFALAHMFPWPARVLMAVFVAGGMALGWALSCFLPWAFRRIVGRDVEPGES
ncbi:MAG: hypothetical protein V3W11_04285 [bacterium]